MRTPDFWKSRGLLSTLLLPTSLFYVIGGCFRQAFSKPVKVSAPVICIGNLSAGGSGKTPITRSIANLLIDMGYTPHIISRGYGGSEEGPLRVQTGKHTAADVGDEPLMLATNHPTWISRDRVKGAQAAIAEGADILLLDDGFQNPALYKDLSFIVVDNTIGFGNGRIIPAGPLRESIQSGVKRADAVILMGTNTDEVNPEITSHLGDTQILRAQISPLPQRDPSTTVVKNLKDKSIFAFAAIGYPQKFYTTLKQQDAVLVGTKDFPDHHPYQRSDLQEVIRLAESREAEGIYTTEKDYAKVPDDLKNRIHCLPIQAVWDNPNAIKSLLNNLPGLK